MSKEPESTTTDHDVPMRIPPPRQSPRVVRRVAASALLAALVLMGLAGNGGAPLGADAAKRSVLDVLRGAAGRQAPHETPKAELPSNGQSGDRHPELQSILSLDTVVVFAVTKYTKTGGSSTWTVFEDAFTPDSIRGHRYLIDFTNGNTNGTNRVSQVIVDIQGREFVGSSECGTSTPSITRIFEPVTGENTITVMLKGTSGTFVHFRIVRVNDPTYVVFGPKRYTKPGSSVHQLDTFNLATGTSPYQVRLYNGGPDGSNRVSNATLSINGTQVMSAADLGTGVATVTKTVTLADTNRIDFYNQSGSGTYLDSVRFRVTDNTAPIVTWLGPVDSLVTTASQIEVSAVVTDETYGTMRVNSRPAFVAPDTLTDIVPMASDGKYPLTITTLNSASLSTATTRTVWRDTQAPALTVASPFPTAQTVTDSLFPVSGTWGPDTTRTVVTIEDDTVGTGFGGSFADTVLLDLGSNRITIRARDAAGNKTQLTWMVFRKLTVEADTMGVAPSALDPTIVSSFKDQVRFLYAASPPLQTDIDTTVLDPERMAVLHGYVKSRDFGPLANVNVRILGHPEYGMTKTRGNGRFDMLVNGGGQLTVRFNRDGHLESQRSVTPGWNEYAILDTVALIGRTAVRSEVNLALNQMVRSRFKTDANGDRNVRLFFQAGTTVKIGRAPGDTVTLSNTKVGVRITEYTVGADGENAMPGALPPTTAYTYCVDLRLDESDTLWIPGEPEPGVVFSKPVSRYVRNFLHFPVGTAVPVGTYDPWSGQWKAGKDAYVLAILSTSGGSATIDSDGNGLADGSGRLDSLGISADELIVLAQEFAVGDTLWRAVHDHFSTPDDNVNVDQAAAQQSFAAGRAGQPMELAENPSLCHGCVIEVENRVLGEEVPIVGTPYSLHYRSFRMPGDVAMRTLRIQVSGDSVPPNVSQIITRLEVAGQRLEQSFTGNASTLKNKIAEIKWDGRDVFGRLVQGAIEALVAVGYRSAPNWRAGAGGRGGPSFNAAGARGAFLGLASGDRSERWISWSRRRVSLGAPGAGSAGLGGWTISPHHFYDVTGRGTLYYGDGRVDLGERTYPVITTVIPGTSINANDVAIGPDGAIYTSSGNAIVKWSSKGVFIAIIAGKSTSGSYSDGVLGTDTYLTGARQLTVARDGSVYFVMDTEASNNCQRVIRIGTDGYVRSIAGDGTRHAGVNYGDGGRADTCGFSVPSAIAIGPDGSIFVGDRETYSVRRIGPDGYIDRYAGTGVEASTATSGRADSTAIGAPSGLACDAAGNLFIAEAGSLRVRKVAPDGSMVTLLDNVTSSFWPYDLVAAPDGAVYIASGPDNPTLIKRVHRLDPDGTLTVIAGGGPGASEYLADGIPALGAHLAVSYGIASAPDGSLFLAQGGVRRIGASERGESIDEFSVTSEDGSEIYFFSLNGRHLRTRDALTGAVRYRFAYDGGGRLSSIHDMNGDATTVTRSSGVPTMITGPFGQETDLTLENGFLKTVTNPAGEPFTLTFGTNGLLTKAKDALDREHTYSFNAEDGRLDSEADPAGGSQALSTVFSGTTREVTRTTGMARVSKFSVTDLFDGSRQHRVIGTNGLLTYQSDSADAKIRRWAPSGLLMVDSLGREPRFGMLRPMPRLTTEKLPSGIARTSEASRTYSGGFDPPTTHGTVSSSFEINDRTAATTEFNSSTRELTLTSAEGRTATATVDSAGRPLMVTIPGLEPITFKYDQRGRDSVIAQAGRGVRFSYDASGRLSVLRDTLGRMTTFGYDNADRLTSQTMPGGRSIAFDYDAVGNLTSVAPPGRPAHEFDYTAVNLTDKYRPPAAGLAASLTQYLYNSDEQVFRILRPDSSNVTLIYGSSNGRLESIAIPRGTLNLSYSSASGLLSGVTSPDGVTLAFGYDGPADTVTTWSGAVTGSVSVSLNRDFRVSSQRVNAGSPMIYGYDDDGLVTRAGPLTIARDADNGLMTGTTLASSTIASVEAYNGFGEPLVSALARGSDTLWKASYTRDGLGRITGISESVLGTTTAYVYAYSDTGFLKSVSTAGTVTELYAYDGNGNRSQFNSPGDSASALNDDDQDRQLRYKDTRYTYTASGELATSITGTDTTRFTYDPLGNLIKIRFQSTDSLNYLVDGRNRRVARKWNGVVTRKWLYQDQLEPVAELNGSDSLLVRYVYATKSHVPDLMIKGDTTYRIVSDHLGSVRLVVNATSGWIAERMDYDGYGRLITDTNPGFQCFGYAGGLWDATSGLARFGARDYDPRVGRWTRRDPVLFAAGSPNLQQYCASEPINHVDPDGLMPIPDCARGILAAYFPGFDLGSVQLFPNSHPPDGASAITLGSSVYFAPGAYDPFSSRGLALIGHEVAHTRQFQHFGVIGFMTRYTTDYLKGQLAGLGHDEAYLQIGFEREARAYERVIREGLRAEYGDRDPCPEGDCE
ncbi:MAG: DUF4157 domain-containing protein [Candidatus Eisenbacteria bacterium]|uniref:DUF4157 domain-containing protein n=1 Tax=Eiseniibacteriota bacterium TaxID=2212470 RepID=A0A849SXZ7_UNCEI|nr:DUF4157 domain-containing protein [Candidatus Eisenbacteria bacterium]